MKISIASLLAVATAIASSAFSAARLNAATITVDYTGTGELTYITAPGGAASQDSFFASITDLIYGTGTLAVTGDVTDYFTGTGSSGPGSAVFTFAGGTLTGSTASLLNLATGQATITYTITSGTGLFADSFGTVIESAQFTSFGSFDPNVPANVSILSATGTLATPEPSTAVTAFAGGIVVLFRMRRKRQPDPDRKNHPTAGVRRTSADAPAGPRQLRWRTRG